MTHIMQDTSEDAFDEILNDGTLGIMLMKAMTLVENHKDMTVRELLAQGVEDEIYPYPDRNLIAPRVTDLCKEGLIYRPYKRECSVTSKRVLVHRQAPPEWEEHRRKLMQFSKGPVVRHRLEIPSKTDDNVVHTALWWSDGSMSCSCNHEYHRPAKHRCHHIKGLYKAVTGLEWSL